MVANKNKSYWQRQRRRANRQARYAERQRRENELNTFNNNSRVVSLSFSVSVLNNPSKFEPPSVLETGFSVESRPFIPIRPLTEVEKLTMIDIEKTLSANTPSEPVKQRIPSLMDLSFPSTIKSLMELRISPPNPMVETEKISDEAKGSFKYPEETEEDKTEFKIPDLAPLMDGKERMRRWVNDEPPYKPSKRLNDDSTDCPNPKTPRYIPSTPFRTTEESETEKDSIRANYPERPQTLEEYEKRFPTKPMSAEEKHSTFWKHVLDQGDQDDAVDVGPVDTDDLLNELFD
jgi:hypothetical protein